MLRLIQRELGIEDGIILKHLIKSKEISLNDYDFR